MIIQIEKNRIDVLNGRIQEIEIMLNNSELKAKTICSLICRTNDILEEIRKTKEDIEKEIEEQNKHKNEFKLFKFETKESEEILEKIERLEKRIEKLQNKRFM